MKNFQTSPTRHCSWNKLLIFKVSTYDSISLTNKQRLDRTQVIFKHHPLPPPQKKISNANVNTRGHELK